MSYHDRDLAAQRTEQPSEAAYGLPPRRDAFDIINNLFGIVVRIVGMGLLAIGLWVGVEVVVEAWALYRDPGRVQAFSDELEKGLHVDALIEGLAEQERGEANVAGTTISVSFLLSWFIVPTLLFTAGYLAMSAVRTGAMLGLGDMGRKSR